jgi:hypothetical protein
VVLEHLREEKHMRKVFVVLALLIFSLPLVFSCQPTAPVYPLEPQVLLLSPGVGSVFAPGPVTVKAYVESVKLVDKSGPPNVPGEGHLIYYLDVLPPVTMGESAIPKTGQYIVSTDLNYTWPDLASGEHLLAVQLVTNNNTPMRYPSAVRVNITVK